MVRVKHIGEAEVVSRVSETPEFKALREQIAPEIEWYVDVNQLVKAYREDLEAQHNPPRIVCVEGPTVLRYSFCRLDGEVRPRSLEIVKVPEVRWTIHHQQRGKFVLVHQRHRTLYGRRTHRWRRDIEQAEKRVKELREYVSPHVSTPRFPTSDWLECADDAGRWLSQIIGPHEVDSLLRWVDDYLADDEQFHGPHDELALPFLVRKMLVEHGYEVPGVARMSSYE